VGKKKTGLTTVWVRGQNHPVTYTSPTKEAMHFSTLRGGETAPIPTLKKKREPQQDPPHLQTRTQSGEVTWERKTPEKPLSTRDSKDESTVSKTKDVPVKEKRTLVSRTPWRKRKKGSMGTVGGGSKKNPSKKPFKPEMKNKPAPKGNI